MPSPHATVRRTPFEGHDRESRPPGIPDALQAGFRRGAGPYRDTSEGAVGDGEGRKSAEVGLQAGGQLGWEPRQRPPRGVGIEPQGTVLGQGVALPPHSRPCATAGGGEAWEREVARKWGILLLSCREEDNAPIPNLWTSPPSRNPQKPRSFVLDRSTRPSRGVRLRTTYSMPRVRQNSRFSGLSPSSLTT